jgi:3-keto-5-aminohexanoate cleavage enzyme
MDKLIIEARVNEYAGRSKNPHVPWTPAEIAETATLCREAGAAVVHFHARGEEGAPEHDIAVYEDIIRRIKAGSDILIHPTLGANANVSDAKQRIAPILALAKDPRTRPHFAPLDMGTTNVDTYDPAAKTFRSHDAVYVNTTQTLEYFAEQLLPTAVKPYASLWNVSFTRQLLAFMDMGIITEPAYACLILTGERMLAGHPGTEQGLDAHRMFMPKDRNIHWTTMNYGGDLLPLVPKIIREGGHISIGLGDWHYPELGLPTNAQLIAHVAKQALAMGREVATPIQAGELLALKI